MLDIFHKFYWDRGYNFSRFKRTLWIAMDYSLSQNVIFSDHQSVTLKLADQNDIAQIENHPEANENILRSVLMFWKYYGMRSLYLGYFNNEVEPAVLQYVLDQDYNDVLKIMPYGRMYRPNDLTSVQVENIYVFKNKRRKNAAKLFENAIFNMLHHKGKNLVRTHIAATNRAALIWASQVGYTPRCWISMLSIDLPLFRNNKPSFLFRQITMNDWGASPLMFFKKHNYAIATKKEHADNVTASI